jgi:hypothetical protein
MRNPCVDRSQRSTMMWCCILFPILIPILPMLCLIWGVEENTGLVLASAFGEIEQTKIGENNGRER